MSDYIIKADNAVIRQQKNTILKEVNIEIKKGEFVYIIGKVGSGKSSFLKTLYAELPFEYGSLIVNDYQLKRIKKSYIPLLRRKTGIVFQDFKLLTDRTVYANLEFVLKATGWRNRKAIKERIDTVLEKVEMPNVKTKMPHELSGGEQQRVVLARALLNSPSLILADEPTGNIDPETSYRLIELLKDICATGKTIVIATHQYDLIEKYPGRVLRCENGTLTEDMVLSSKSTFINNEEIVNNSPIKEEEIEPVSVIEASIETPSEEEKELITENIVSLVKEPEEDSIMEAHIETSEQQEENLAVSEVSVLETIETQIEEETIITEEILDEPEEKVSPSGETIETTQTHITVTEEDYGFIDPEIIEESTTVSIEETVKKEKLEETPKIEEEENKEKNKPEVFGFELMD